MSGKYVTRHDNSLRLFSFLYSSDELSSEVRRVAKVVFLVEVVRLTHLEYPFSLLSMRM